MSEREGWHWLVNARDNHYFRDGRSLCGRWGIFGVPSGGMGGRNDCKGCTKKLEKKKTK